MSSFLGPKRPFFFEPYGESEATFYSGLYLAHPRLNSLRHCEIGFAFYLVNVERGRSHIDATNGNFCSSSRRIDTGIYNGCISQKGEILSKVMRGIISERKPPPIWPFLRQKKTI
jgi:hypothetical protein